MIIVCIQTIQRVVQEIIKWANTCTTHTGNDELDKHGAYVRTLHTNSTFPPISLCYELLQYKMLFITMSIIQICSIYQKYTRYIGNHAYRGYVFSL